MRIVENDVFHEAYVETTLANGLKVVLWKKKDYVKSFFMMATPLGAMDLKQIDANGKQYSFPAGIAHFLEHKMFEMKGADVMERFSQLSANVNAFTSYGETAYYFSTTASIKKPLELLLDFVQDLEISETSIEKEKGIIIQELHMYEQMSETRLIMEIFSSLYQNHPLKYDIGGDDKSVQSISLAQLNECYKTNYHPSTMILMGVTSEDPHKVLDIIIENQQKKNFSDVLKMTRETVQEDAKVARDHYCFKMDVSVERVAIAYKLQGICDVKKRLKSEWCIKFLLDAYFSSLNEEYQQWIDDEIINDYVGSEIDFGQDHGLIMFFAETRKVEMFSKLIEEVMKRIMEGKIDNELLLRLKRRYYAQNLRSLDDFESLTINFVRNYFDGMDFFESISIVDSIRLEDVKKAAKLVQSKHRAIVELLPEKSQ